MPNQEYQKDDSGNIIDPPVIRDYERRISEAADSGSNDAVAAVQAEYDKARVDLVNQQSSDSPSEETSSDDSADDSADETPTPKRRR